MTSPGEVVTVFTYPYLSAGAPALGEAKGLTIYIFITYNLYNFNNIRIKNFRPIHKLLFKLINQT